MYYAHAKCDHGFDSEFHRRFSSLLRQSKSKCILLQGNLNTTLLIIYILPKGNIAKDSKDETVLIEGDSSTFATIVASRLQAKRVELIVDQIGIFSADPQHFPSTSLLLNLLTFPEVRYFKGVGKFVDKKKKGTRNCSSFHWNPVICWKLHYTFIRKESSFTTSLVSYAFYCPFT